MKKQPDVLTVRDVANVLGVSPAAIYARLASGSLPAPDKITIVNVRQHRTWNKETIAKFLQG